MTRGAESPTNRNGPDANSFPMRRTRVDVCVGWVFIVRVKQEAFPRRDLAHLPSSFPKSRWYPTMASKIEIASTEKMSSISCASCGPGVWWRLIKSVLRLSSYRLLHRRSLRHCLACAALFPRRDPTHNERAEFKCPQRDPVLRVQQSKMSDREDRKIVQAGAGQNGYHRRLPETAKNCSQIQQPVKTESRRARE